MLVAGLLDQDAAAGKQMMGLIAQQPDGFHRHAADQPGDGLVVRDDADDIGAALHFVVQVLDPVGADAD